MAAQFLRQVQESQSLHTTSPGSSRKAAGREVDGGRRQQSMHVVWCFITSWSWRRPKLTIWNYPSLWWTQRMCPQILRTCSVRLSGSVVSPSRATTISRAWNWSVATFGPACVCSRRWKWWCHQTGRSICPTAAWTTDALWCNWTRWWWMLISESLLHPWWNQLEVIFVDPFYDRSPPCFQANCHVCDDFFQSPLAQINPDKYSDDFIRFLQITK